MVLNEVKNASMISCSMSGSLLTARKVWYGKKKKNDDDDEGQIISSRFFCIFFLPSFIWDFSFVRHLVDSFLSLNNTHTQPMLNLWHQNKKIYIYMETPPGISAVVALFAFFFLFLCPLLYRSDRVIWGISLIILSNNSHMALADDDDDRVVISSIDFNFEANVAK